MAEQYGVSEYGSVKYTHNEMYWSRYLYRYFAFTHELSSVQTIDRILEAKNLLLDDEAELQRQYEIFRKIRNGI